MTLLAVGGLGEDIQCIHVQYHIYACMLMPSAYYSLYNCDYFMGLIFMVSKIICKTTKIEPQNFHADGRFFSMFNVTIMA